MPICTVDKKRLGFSDSLSAVFAPLSPRFTAALSFDFFAETMDISDSASIPFIKIRISKIKTSNYCITFKVAAKIV